MPKVPESTPMTLEWLAGFYEGEGYCGIHQHHNHTTKGGVRVPYKNPMPKISISQKERQVLDLIVDFLASHGIHSRVYSKNKGGAFEVTIVGYSTCVKAFKLLYPQLLSDRKREQMLRTMTYCREHAERKEAS